MNILEALQWGVQHGSVGVLAVVCAGEGYMLYRFWQRGEELHEARISDMKAMIDVTDKLHDKVHKTVDIIEKVAEAASKRRGT